MKRRSVLKALSATGIIVVSGCSILSNQTDTEWSKVQATTDWTVGDCSDEQPSPAVEWSDGDATVTGGVVLDEGCYETETEAWGPSDSGSATLRLTVMESEGGTCVDCRSTLAYTAEVAETGTAFDELKVLHDTPEQQVVAGTFTRES